METAREVGVAPVAVGSIGVGWVWYVTRRYLAQPSTRDSGAAEIADEGKLLDDAK